MLITRSDSALKIIFLKSPAMLLSQFTEVRLLPMNCSKMSSVF